MSEQNHSLEHLLAGISSPLRRQLLTLAIIGKRLKERGKAIPVLVGGCALAYYSRGQYFTSDIDLACGNREALSEVLKEMGFATEGRYWVHHSLNLMVEAPAGVLIDEQAPREIVELEDGLECCIIGIEDLLIDRMNACVHWKATHECELVEVLVSTWNKEIDWEYLLERAARPENDTLDRFITLRSTYAS